MARSAPVPHARATPGPVPERGFSCLWRERGPKKIPSSSRRAEQSAGLQLRLPRRVFIFPVLPFTFSGGSCSFPSPVRASSDLSRQVREGAPLARGTQHTRPLRAVGGAHERSDGRSNSSLGRQSKGNRTGQAAPVLGTIIAPGRRSGSTSGPQGRCSWEQLSVVIQHGSRVVGVAGRHLHLYAALCGLEHCREAGLVCVGEHAGEARLLQPRLGELSVAPRVVAGNGDEAVVGHGE